MYFDNVEDDTDIRLPDVLTEHDNAINEPIKEKEIEMQLNQLGQKNIVVMI